MALHEIAGLSKFASAEQGFAGRPVDRVRISSWYRSRSGRSHPVSHLDTRRKTGVPVLVEKAKPLSNALAALAARVCILTIEYRKPFTIDGFSG